VSLNHLRVPKPAVEREAQTRTPTVGPYVDGVVAEERARAAESRCLLGPAAVEASVVAVDV
jgi:hypothetical protein